jgi:hypothetical protein
VPGFWHGSLTTQLTPDRFVCVTPPDGEQLSAVHGFPSSTDASVLGTQACALLQVSMPLQALASAQDAPEASGEPGTHCVPLQTSLPLQGLPSLQDGAGERAKRVAPAGQRQTSLVHGLPSFSGGAGVQTHDDPLSVTLLVHRSASAQEIFRIRFVSASAM